MRGQKQVIKELCPTCEDWFELNMQPLEIHEFVTCPYCFELLEITSLHPLKLAVAYLDNEEQSLEDNQDSIEYNAFIDER